MGRAVTDAMPLVRVLRDPAVIADLAPADWTAILTIARAEQLIAALAWRCDGLPLPPHVAAILADARDAAEAGRRAALWEAEMARRALAPLDGPVVLLKGTAYVAAGLAAGQGRFIGDLDILVRRAALPAIEAALLAAGWEWVKPDAYDDAYYRTHMHELPPLIHRERDRMIDVHHTILPLTARPTPDAAALIGDAIPLRDGLSVLAPADMIVHAAAHLFADGDLAGGLRNLWDIHRLVEEFGVDGLADRAARHALWPATHRALRLASELFATPIPDAWRGPLAADALYRRRLLARDGWGRARCPVTRLGFYIRSHALRMPPPLLARHLWTKWRRQRGASRSSAGSNSV